MNENESKTINPAPLRCGNLLLRFGSRPYIMGILNTTPDSFSDGGQFLDSQQAIEQGLAMVEQGADLVDVGGESSRPGAEPVSVAQEIARVVPVIEGIRSYSTAPISIDTVKAPVARAALEAGAAMINDISACRWDPEMPSLAAANKVPLVLMHMRGEPKTMQKGEIVYDDLLGEIEAHLKQASDRAVAAGVPREAIIWDPGIGFGKTVAHNLTILNRIGQLAKSGHALLVGPSRKSFIGKILDADVEQRMFGTAATVAAAVMGGAHIIRVHDVAQMRQVAIMAQAINNER